MESQISDQEIQKEVKYLIQQGLYESAESLASFLSPNTYDLEMGHIHFLQKSYTRALSNFKLALAHANETDANEIMQKCAECHYLLSNYKVAYELLQTRKPSSLNLKSLMILGSVSSRMISDKTKPRLYYGEVVRRNPFNVEAIIKLLESGMNVRELYQISDKLAQAKWLHSTITAYAFLANHDYEGAIAKFEESYKTFPLNIDLLKNIATSHYYNVDLEKAGQIFQEIRQRDRNYVDAMDIYALIIYKSGNLQLLNTLSNELLDVAPHRSETWTSIAIYFDAKGKKEVALSHVERAISLNPQNSISQLCKASILVKINQVDAALAVYNAAKICHPNYHVYKGLIDTFIKHQNIRAAIRMLSEAEKIMPKSYYIQVLKANCQSQTKESKNHKLAMNLYNSIIEQHPKCIDAIVGLAKLHAIQDNNNEAIKLLKLHLNTINSDLLHIALGDILATEEKTYDVAVAHYTEAIKLNALSEDAVIGLKKVEKLLNGPDASQAEFHDDLNEQLEGDDEFV